MSEDLLRLCRIYDFQMGQREYFFEHWKGGPLNPKWMLVQFHRCFESDRHPERKRARPYDLRHTFATHILMGWVDGKRDIMSLLPFLSAYMGHSDYKATQYYLRLTAEIYPEMVEMLAAECMDIIPPGGEFCENP